MGYLVLIRLGGEVHRTAQYQLLHRLLQCLFHLLLHPQQKNRRQIAGGVPMIAEHRTVEVRVAQPGFQREKQTAWREFVFINEDISVESGQLRKDLLNFTDPDLTLAGRASNIMVEVQMDCPAAQVVLATASLINCRAVNSEVGAVRVEW